MPRTRQRAAAKRKATAEQEDADGVSTSTPDEKQHQDCPSVLLNATLRWIDDRKNTLQRWMEDELAAMDRNLAILLAQIPEDDLNQPAVTATCPKESLSSDFFNSKKLVSSTANKAATLGAKFVGPASAKAKALRKIKVADKASASVPNKVPASAPAVRAKEPRQPATEPVKPPTDRAAPVTASTRQSRPRGRPSKLDREAMLRDTTPASSLTQTADKFIRPRPRTRSMSRDRSLSVSTILYQTPQQMASRSAMLDSMTVTPKCDPYGPIALKRQPREGEMAISMSGSPLMVNLNVREPNIAVPVNDEVYCIMPTGGPVPSIAGIDDETRQKLRNLRENLDKIIGD